MILRECDALKKECRMLSELAKCSGSNCMHWVWLNENQQGSFPEWWGACGFTIEHDIINNGHEEEIDCSECPRNDCTSDSRENVVPLKK